MLDRFELVIFDWDGTLVDSIDLIVKTVQRTAIAHQFDVPTEQQCRDIIGLSLVPALKRLFPEITENEIQRVRGTYRDAYLEKRDLQLPMFDGVLDVLESLKSKGKKLAVATGKGRPGLNEAMQKTGLTSFFDYSRTSDEAESKPSPDMLNQIMSELSVIPQNAVMIGDSIHDLDMAKRAGMASIGVEFGAHSKEKLELHDPIAIIKCYSQLTT